MNSDALKRGVSEDYGAQLPGLQARALPFGFKGMCDYLCGKITPARALTDSAAADIIPLLNGNIIEIGGSMDYYARYANAKSTYDISNITGDPRFLYLDAMNMHLTDDSVDNFVCISVLEHIPDPFKAIAEMRRTLKKGGKLLLIVPFIYPFHADPSDFYRYSDKGLAVMLKGFHIRRAESLGNIFSTLALLLQKPFRASFVNKWRKESRTRYLAYKLATSPLTLFCRIIGFGFYLSSFLMRNPSDFASQYCVLAEKYDDLL
jgi:SAM-dependent methyltransferase